jgi:hypothetical protein
MTDTALSRRDLFATPLLGASAFAALSLANASAQAKNTPTRKLDLGDPNEPGFNPRNAHHNAEVYARMQLGVDGKSNYGWFKGRVFAVVGDDQIVQPLFDLEGFGTNRNIRQADGTYRHQHREVGYYKDLRTGQIMEKWRNPFIDEDTDVFPINNDPVNAILGPVIKAKLGEGQNVTEFPLMLPWTMMGDLAMTSSDVNLRWRNVLDPKVWVRESTGPYVRVSEYLQFYANAADLKNWRNLERIKQHGAWQRLGSWLPWMLMGGRKGHLFYRCHTKALDNLDELPRDIYAYTEKRWPKYLEAPETWVEPNVTSFEVYARDRKPVPVKRRS